MVSLKLRSPCHIRMYKTNINLFHNKYLSKAAKILQWQFFWSICDTSFNLPPYANYTACCLLCQRWDHCDQHLVTPDRNRLAPEMVEDLVMLKCNLRLLRNMSTVWKTYLLCLVWLRSDIQYICTYLGKPVLIWENNIWTSGFWFWFSDVFWILFIVFWSLCLCLSVFLSFRLFVLVNIYEFILVHN